MVNIGTLAAFTLVSIAVPILRKRRPDLQAVLQGAVHPRCCRSLAAVVCVYLMLNLSLETWIRFVIWMVLGFIIYFGYSRHRSRLAVHGRESDRAAAGQTTQQLTQPPRVRRPAALPGRRGVVVPSCRGRRQSDLTLLTTLVSDSLASPKSSVVLGS